MLDNSSILITGGTGTLGKALTRKILANYPKVKRLVIYSRDEQKQFFMSKEFPESKYPNIRYFIGDIRDYSRLKRALNNIDYVIHTAAMKHVPIAEYNPMECIKTNVLGAENLINACFSKNIKKVVALSTDKAAAPINLYGATKLTSDKLFIAANNIKGTNDIKFSVVRYGNVMGSNGSVIPYFISIKDKGEFPITDPKMTRFNILIDEGVDLVLYTLKHGWGGEIYVPKIPSYRITDLAKAISPTNKHKIIGLRPGEKIHEEMITSSDSFFTYDLGKYFAILPSNPSWNIKKYISNFNAIKVPDNFSYNSGQNENFISIMNLKKLIYDQFGSKLENE